MNRGSRTCWMRRARFNLPNLGRVRAFATADESPHSCDRSLGPVAFPRIPSTIPMAVFTREYVYDSFAVRSVYCVA